jgi:hypothetical protein
MLGASEQAVSERKGHGRTTDRASNPGNPTTRRASPPPADGVLNEALGEVIKLLANNYPNFTKQWG